MWLRFVCFAKGHPVIGVWQAVAYSTLVPHPQVLCATYGLGTRRTAHNTTTAVTWDLMSNGILVGSSFKAWMVSAWGVLVSHKTVAFTLELRFRLCSYVWHHSPSISATRPWLPQASTRQPSCARQERCWPWQWGAGMWKCRWLRMRIIGAVFRQCAILSATDWTHL